MFKQITAKLLGIGRNTQPSAVSDLGDVQPFFDDVGRQVTYPYQVRDLLSTAYVSLTTGTEATLLTGQASTFRDLVSVICANSSTVAASVDFRDATGGGVVLTLEVPANSTAGATFTSPLRQNESANTWTADMNDLTGTTVNVAAQFVDNI
ncbi:hypothetical protein CMI37_11705 [Candidatus Pacearchaeota archaeon]|nr:hypothetical protein [Candidatus Pacearchaeota archaeon]|tara:strand:- start:7130 stop:7582 length:453 start_codon:yes stop_codon:yes gene_type:complete